MLDSQLSRKQTHIMSTLVPDVLIKNLVELNEKCQMQFPGVLLYIGISGMFLQLKVQNRTTIFL